MQKRLLLLITFVLLTFFSKVSQVEASTLWITPGSGTFAKNSTIKVDVGVDTKGESVNAVQANLAFPSDKLQFVSVSTSGSALTIFAEKTVAGSVVRIGGGKPTPGITGSKFIASIYFKVKQDLGSGVIGFADDSVVLRDSDSQNSLTSKGSATYKFSVATGANLTPTVAPQDISDIKIESITTDSATITWKTTKAQTSVVEYGETTTYKQVQSQDELVTDHLVIIPAGLLKSGTLYNFRVRGVDAKNLESVSSNQTFTTKGFAVIIKVVQNSNPISAALVTLYSDPQTATTNAVGVAEFVDVIEGTHRVVVSYQDQTAESEISVKPDSAPQNFEVSLNPAPVAVATNQFPQIYVIALLGIAVILTLLFVMFIFKNRKKKTELSTVSVIDTSSPVGSPPGLSFPTKSNTTTEENGDSSGYPKIPPSLQNME